jgi:hypothetical protein
MKILSLLPVGMCLTAMLGFAQMIDIVKVTLPHGAMVGTATLRPGDYTIRELTEDGNSSLVLQIRSSTGASVAAWAMRISEPNNRATDQTQVILRRDGDKYQVDKIWLRGRDYGYELVSGMGHE